MGWEKDPVVWDLREVCGSLGSGELWESFRKFWTESLREFREQQFLVFGEDSWIFRNWLPVLGPSLLVKPQLSPKLRRHLGMQKVVRGLSTEGTLMPSEQERHGVPLISSAWAQPPSNCWQVT